MCTVGSLLFPSLARLFPRLHHTINTRINVRLYSALLNTLTLAVAYLQQSTTVVSTSLVTDTITTDAGSRTLHKQCINDIRIVTPERWLYLVLWHCWLGVRKSNWPVKLSDKVLAWLSVCSKVQMIYICLSRYHCHVIISCFIKIQNGLSFWCWLIQVGH